jgi:glutamate formiminotransferase/formiminotetrahydrofolate cyclodeaminase
MDHVNQADGPKWIECVPNFSEGRNPGVIRQITDEIESISGVRLLNVDQGQATNRTVVTFAGEPGAVIEAAFQAIRKAGELIDMRKHKGAHPRMGATDVCPLVPLRNMTLSETAEYARILGKRVGEELGIPVYLYESAQQNVFRKSLSKIREGEYEGYSTKIKEPGWYPDFGPCEFDLQRGATVIGARDFLVAYNVNLNTTSTRRANAVAFDVREAGRVKMMDGKPMLDDEGRKVMVPGSLKYTKAIGWYIEEYGLAQVSMNLTNIHETPVHIAFDEVCRKAEARGIRVTGSELVGLIPLDAMLDAGKYFLRKQKRSAGVPEKELIKIAVRSLGLNELESFRPEERIIEYLLADKAGSKLIRMPLNDFADETSDESPAPGGGSIAAYVGSLGAALAAMVANLSAQKQGWDQHWETFSELAEQGQYYKSELLSLVDADTNAFNKLMSALTMPKDTDAERQARTEAVRQATRGAMEIPLKVMTLASESMAIMKELAENGNPNSVSDAGVAAICADAAVRGAFLNVRINAASYYDKNYVKEVMERGQKLVQEAGDKEREILKLADARILNL